MCEYTKQVKIACNFVFKSALNHASENALNEREGV